MERQVAVRAPIPRRAALTNKTMGHIRERHWSPASCWRKQRRPRDGAEVVDCRRLTRETCLVQSDGREGIGTKIAQVSVLLPAPACSKLAPLDRAGVMRTTLSEGTATLWLDMATDTEGRGGALLICTVPFRSRLTAAIRASASRAGLIPLEETACRRCLSVRDSVRRWPYHQGVFP